MPEVFSAERFKKIMELRGAVGSKTMQSDSVPPQNRQTNQIHHETPDRIDVLNEGLRDLQRNNAAQTNSNQLPEVTIVAEKKQQYFAIRYQSQTAPSYLSPASMPSIFDNGRMESDIEEYLDSCQKFRGDCVDQKMRDMRENDEHLLEMLDEAMDIRLERMMIGLECRANKLGDIGLQMEAIADDYDEINPEDGEKSCVKKMKKIGKKLASCAKSSVKIGKKQLKVSDEEMAEINEVDKVLQAEFGNNEGFSMQDSSGKEDIKLSGTARDKLFKFINDTYKMAGKDLDYCGQIEKEVMSKRGFNASDLTAAQQALLEKLSR